MITVKQISYVAAQSVIVGSPVVLLGSLIGLNLSLPGLILGSSVALYYGARAAGKHFSLKETNIQLLTVGLVGGCSVALSAAFIFAYNVKFAFDSLVLVAPLFGLGSVFKNRVPYQFDHFQNLNPLPSSLFDFRFLENTQGSRGSILKNMFNQSTEAFFESLKNSLNLQKNLQNTNFIYQNLKSYTEQYGLQKNDLLVGSSLIDTSLKCHDSSFEKLEFIYLAYVFDAMKAFFVMNTSNDYKLSDFVLMHGGDKPVSDTSQSPLDAADYLRNPASKAETPLFKEVMRRGFLTMMNKMVFDDSGNMAIKFLDKSYAFEHSDPEIQDYLVKLKQIQEKLKDETKKAEVEADVQSFLEQWKAAMVAFQSRSGSIDGVPEVNDAPLFDDDN